VSRRSVVFDFGGVLLRWQPLLLLRELLPEASADDAALQRLAAHFFQGFAVDADWVAFDRGALSLGTLAARIAVRSGLAPQRVRAVLDAVPGWLELQCDTLALVHALRAAGHAVYYLSNMPAPYAAALERRHPLRQWFDGGVFSGRVGLVKPQPAIFGLAQAAFGSEPTRTLFIDDHAANVEAASAHGWQALRFDGAPALAASLQRAGWL
jgi:putative hydrolase of the HAD superfamily